MTAEDSSEQLQNREPSLVDFLPNKLSKEQQLELIRRLDQMVLGDELSPAEPWLQEAVSATLENCRNRALNFPTSLPRAMREALIRYHNAIIDAITDGYSISVCGYISASLNESYGFNFGRGYFITDSQIRSGYDRFTHKWVHFKSVIYDPTVCQYNEAMEPKNKLPLGLTIATPGSKLYERW